MTLVLLIVFSLAEQGMLILHCDVGGYSMLRVDAIRRGRNLLREGDGAPPVRLLVQGVPQEAHGILREENLRRKLPLRREAPALRDEGNQMS